MKVVSLFAGIGGLDYGFIKNGFDVIWANDFDKFACQTYKENWGDHIHLGDIYDLHEEIPKHDVLIGGFPCQPFSTLGKLKGFEDERGTLFFLITEILKKHDTKIVVLENVKNLLHHDGGKTFERMVTELDDLGYYVNYEIMNTKDYGVPQRRNRIFIVAFNKKYFKKETLQFPKTRELEIGTSDLLEQNVDIKYFISKKMYPTIMGNGTKGYIVKPTINQELSKTLTATMHKMHRASQDNYWIDEESYEKNPDPKKTTLRKLTPLECQRLQGFPEDFRIPVSDTQAYRQFGNAVSANVSDELAKQIKKYVKDNLKR